MPLQARRGGGADVPRQSADDFLRSEIKQKLLDGFSADNQARVMWTSMPKQLGVQIPGIPVGAPGKPFYGTIPQEVGRGKNRRPATFGDLANSAVGTGHFGSVSEYEAALAKARGVEALDDDLRAKEVERAQGRQRFVGSVRGIGTDASLTAFRNLDSGIAEGIDDAYELLGKLMPTVHAEMTAKAGKEVADGFLQQAQAKLAEGKVQEVVDMVGFTQDQLRKVVPPEVNTVEGFNAPLLKDMPAWGQALAIGGVGGASTALAMHLMAQGQQQQSSMEYAAAMQALNAY